MHVYFQIVLVFKVPNLLKTLLKTSKIGLQYYETNVFRYLL